MEALVGAIGGALAALLVVGLVALVRRRSRSRADLEAMLLAAQREADDLRARLDELTPRPAPAPVREVTEYVITDIGRAEVPAEPPVEVPDRLVLSATLGAPLVKTAAFAHGLRRALSAESRNRIRFEMRREVRASRKRRRAQVKQHLRDVRAAQRESFG
ncbi:MAG: hypothetical protein J7518_06930 [Nocardioidaceae bacterium]|nr:hypothetical protein [Nocardioidaceae bacterium]